jgi:hypothetical protein
VPPTLLSLKAARSDPNVERILRARLAALAHCPAYVWDFDKPGLGGPFLVREYEALDDRTAVSLDLGAERSLSARVASSAASDSDCVERTIEAWTFSDDEWQLLREALPAVIVYRFKASASERAAGQQEAARRLAEVCAAVEKASPAEAVGRYLALHDDLPPRLGLRLGRVARSLDQLPPTSTDRLTIFGAVLTELSLEFGLGASCAVGAGSTRVEPKLSTQLQHFDVDAAALRAGRSDPGPAFVSLSTRPGVSSGALEAAVRMNLRSLSACIAFAKESGDALEPFVPSGDDLVTVALDVEPALDQRERRSLRVVVKVLSPGWSDPLCIRSVVSNWEFPLAQLEASASHASQAEPAALFSYRFRPADEQRARVRAANASALAPLCEAYRGVSPSASAPEELALRHLAEAPPYARHLLRGSAAVVALARERGSAGDQAWLWADSWREVELLAGVERPCPSFADWPTSRGR